MLREHQKKVDSRNEVLLTTILLLDAYADLYASAYGAHAVMEQPIKDKSMQIVGSSMAGTKGLESSSTLSNPMTLGTLLAVCETNTHAASAPLRHKLASATCLDDKYVVLATFFLETGMEQLDAWDVEVFIDLMRLRESMNGTSPMLMQFEPQAVLKATLFNET